jgi:hypothetical protein
MSHGFKFKLKQPANGDTTDYAHNPVSDGHHGKPNRDIIDIS